MNVTCFKETEINCEGSAVCVMYTTEDEPGSG